MQRRDLLKIAGASAALLGLPSVGLAKQAWSVDPFSLGIASGSPTSNSVVLWTRLGTPALEAAGLTTKPVAVTWQLAHDQQFSRVVATGAVQATAALGYTPRSLGLSPGAPTSIVSSPARRTAQQVAHAPFRRQTLT